MYRENARKTNNLDTQCEFAIFVSEIATNKQLTERDTVKKEYLSEAEKLFKHLSAKGHANSQYHLAQLYASGALNKSGNPELDKAFPLFVQASKHVHAKALER
jgi:TPR repeat protein